MKSVLKEIIAGEYPGVEFDILTPPNPEMGDYSTNLAFVLGKKEGLDPNKKAKEIIEDLIKILPPGVVVDHRGAFINISLKTEFLIENLEKIIKEKDKYGSQKEKKSKINLEFVSANPTGPLTVGNARAASYGDTLGNILIKSGYKVGKEYYVNDVGVQVKKLGESIELRIREEKGEKIEFRDDLYQGEYIKELAKNFKGHPDEIVTEAVNMMIKNAQMIMKSLGVEFDEWFHESKLHDSDEIKETLNKLKDIDRTEVKEGATWLKFGDDKEAVLVKSDGSTTYLMNDIAYTRNKLEKRGFDKAINIWGTDHHGDVERLIEGVKALGFMPERLEILLHQLVALRKGGELVRMSKRAGNIETLEELLKEVGKDAVRFFFLSKDLNTHMEFDIDLAKEHSKKNPIYYIQYAYARLNQVFSKASRSTSRAKLELLKEPEEILLMRKMVKFPELVDEISKNYQVHHLAQYTFELASEFHNFYEKHRVVQDGKDLEESRVALCKGISIVLGICLGLMGISAPEKM